MHVRMPACLCDDVCVYVCITMCGARVCVCDDVMCVRDREGRYER